MAEPEHNHDRAPDRGKRIPQTEVDAANRPAGRRRSRHQAAGEVGIDQTIGGAERAAVRLLIPGIPQGPSLRRYMPRAMGRAFKVLKKTSHIALTISDEAAPKKKRVKPARKAKAAAPTTPVKA